MSILDIFRMGFQRGFPLGGLQGRVLRFSFSRYNTIFYYIFLICQILVLLLGSPAISNALADALQLGESNCRDQQHADDNHQNLRVDVNQS